MSGMKKQLRRRVMGIALLVIGIVLALFVRHEPPYRGKIVAGAQPLIIAHRGFGNHAPDNSLVAVRMAIDSGLDGVDLDAQMTADGELVIFHDPSLDRLTDRSGFIKDLTVEEITQADLGSKFGPAFAGERPATLEEVIQEVAGRLLVIVELKASGIRSDGSEDQAIQLIRKYDAYEFVYLSSFNPFVLYRLRKRDPRLHTVFIFKDENVDPDKLREIHPTELKGIPFFLRQEPYRRLIRRMIEPDLLSAEITVKEQTVRDLQAKGHPVMLWPPNTEAQIHQSIARNPWGIITDEPLITD